MFVSKPTYQNRNSIILLKNLHELLINILVNIYTKFMSIKFELRDLIQTDLVISRSVIFYLYYTYYIINNNHNFVQVLFIRHIFIQLEMKLHDIGKIKLTY